MMMIVMMMKRMKRMKKKQYKLHKTPNLPPLTANIYPQLSKPEPQILILLQFVSPAYPAHNQPHRNDTLNITPPSPIPHPPRTIPSVTPVPTNSATLMQMPKALQTGEAPPTLPDPEMCPAMT